MKSRLWPGCLLLAALSASSADAPFIIRENPALPLMHPFRKVGDKYCDLRPLFKWYEIPVGRRTMKYDGKPTPHPKPQPAWEFIEGKVSQVLNDGLIVKEDGFIEPDRRTGIGSESFR